MQPYPDLEVPEPTDEEKQAQAWADAGMSEELEAENAATDAGYADAAQHVPPNPTPAYETEYQQAYDMELDNQADDAGRQIAETILSKEE